MKELETLKTNRHKYSRIAQIQSLFRQNEKQLRKQNNIPETEDCEILAGYVSYTCDDSKILVSEDEHFWAHSDNISKELGILVVAEWDVQQLIT